MTHDDRAASRARDALERWRVRVQDRLWRRAEAAARARGMEAVRSPGGWSLTVRDPRWNRRRRCAACGGAGRGRAGPCRFCDGTGVTVLTPVVGERRGRDGARQARPGDGRRGPADLGSTA